MPRGDLIDSLRKQKGWTQQQCAEGSLFGERTLQKAIAGIPVDITTLRAIADRLEVPYESLIISDEKEPETATQSKHAVEFKTDGFVLKLQIELTGTPEAKADSPQIAALVDFLRKIFPDNQDIKVVGIIGATAIISVALTPANLFALTTSALDEGDFHVKRVITPDHYEVDGEYRFITDDEIDKAWDSIRFFVCDYKDRRALLNKDRQLSDFEKVCWKLDPGINSPVDDWVHDRLNSPQLQSLRERVRLWQRRRKHV